MYSIELKVRLQESTDDQLLLMFAMKKHYQLHYEGTNYVILICVSKDEADVLVWLVEHGYGVI